MSPLRPSRLRTRSLMLLAAGAALVATSLPLAGATSADDPNAFSVSRYSGVPIHWNKCSEIGYRINTSRMPARGGKQVNEAIRRLEERSGLNFSYKGTTSVFPSLRPNYPNNTRLIVGWTTPDRSREMPRRVAGVGGYQYYVIQDNDGPEGVIAKGYVQLNANLNDDIVGGFGAGPRTGYLGTKGQLIMHELGHAVGLNHVNDRDQIMFDTMTRKEARWGRGDANGLKRVGISRDCTPNPPRARTTGATTVTHHD